MVARFVTLVAFLASLAVVLSSPMAASAEGAPSVAPAFQAAHAAGWPGEPISYPLRQGGRFVQYFQHGRMELLADGGVEFGRLGTEMTVGRGFQPIAPFTSSADRWYIVETSHSVAQPLLGGWLGNGGAGRLGFPVSEALVEGAVLVQYFERARLEVRGDGVVLGNLGAEAWTLRAAESQLGEFERRLLEKINAARSAAGVAPLAEDAAVTALARYRSDDMATRHYFSHYTPEGETVLQMLPAWGIPFTYAGETLQRNNKAGAGAVDLAFSSLMGSPAHRAILLNARFAQVGVGHALDGDMHYFAVVIIQR